MDIVGIVAGMVGYLYWRYVWVVPLGLPYHFFSCQQFHLGAAMGGLLLSSFMPERKEIKKEEWV